MNDAEIYNKGGTKDDVNKHARKNGADLTKEDFDYKQKALDHVRSVCEELKETKISAPPGNGIKGQCVRFVTPHLEHWLRGIDAGQHKKLMEEKQLPVPRASIFGKFANEHYDLTKDGENQSEEFYKAYCNIVGV